MEHGESIADRNRFEWVSSSFKSFGSAFLNFLFPPVCLFCEVGLQSHEKIACSICMEDVEEIEDPFCKRCGIPLSDDGSITKDCGWCRQIVPDVKILRSAFKFGGLVENIVHNFKYNGWTGLSSLMAAGMYKVLSENKGLQGIDLIIPVPLHSVRKRERGYNQSELLSKELSKLSGIETEVNLLKRIRNTPSQTKLNFEQRKANVGGAFRLKDSDEVKGANVLLIDDVLTTGSTVSACAEVLLDAGAGEVSILTYARAVS